MGWRFQSKIVPSDMPANAEFGASVALDGEVALIGANSDDRAGVSPGCAYI